MPRGRLKVESKVQQSICAKLPTNPLNKACDDLTMISKAQNQAEANLVQKPIKSLAKKIRTTHHKRVLLAKHVKSNN